MRAEHDNVAMVVFCAAYVAYLLVDAAWRAQRTCDGTADVSETRSLWETSTERLGLSLAIARSFGEIERRDPYARPRNLVGQANAIFEFVLDAFSKGDTKRLVRVLSPEVYSAFSESIELRKGRGDSLEIIVVGNSPPEVLRVVSEDRRSEITIQFEFEMFVTRASRWSGVHEEHSARSRVVDVWTFVKSRADKTWTIVATNIECREADETGARQFTARVNSPEDA